MPLWYPAQAASPVAITPSLRRRRHHYRHQIQSLAYLNLDQSNGGIIRNLGGAGIAVQAVAPLNIDQRVFLRFDLANPRIRIEGTGRVAWADPYRSGRHRISGSFSALPARVERMDFHPTFDHRAGHRRSQLSLYRRHGGAVVFSCLATRNPL